MNDEVAGPIERELRTSNGLAQNQNGAIASNLNRIEYLLEDLQKQIINLETTISPVLNYHMSADPGDTMPAAEATSGMAEWTNRLADNLYSRIESIKEITHRVDL